MANYNTLKGAIEQVVKTNGNNEITGALLQQSLIAMINSLGAGYQFAGVAVPATNPGTPDYNVFYFAGPGTYPNFNNATIPARNVGLLSYNGTWHVSSVQTTPFSAESIVNDIIQLYDGSTPVYPRTQAEAVFFDNDTTKTLDQQFSQLGQEISDVDFNLGDDLARRIPMSLGYIVCNGAAGTVVDLTPVTHSTYKYAIVSCAPGDVFYIRGKGGNADRLYCFIDSENKVISSATSGLTWLDYHKLIAPANTAKFIVNDETGQAISYFGEKSIDKIDEKIGEIPLVARCLDMQYDGAKTVTMDVIYLYRYNQLFKTIYCDGDASSHSPKSFIMGSPYGALLVVDSNYNVVLRLTNAALQNGDIVLLSYSDTLGFDGGGLLYPSISRIKVEFINVIKGELNYKNVSLVSGGVNKNTGGNTIGSTSRTGYLPITEGYGIFVKGILGSTVTPLALYDANNVFIEAEQKVDECFRSADYLKRVGAKYFRCTIGAEQVASGDWYIVYDKKVLQPINSVTNELAKLSDVVNTLPDPAEPRSSIRLLDAIGNPLNPVSYQTDESGNEIPTTREVLNVQKKAKQLSDIEWTPLASVPNNNGTFPANVKVTGIPYTSVKECDKYVGWDVSIHTFMTAVNNPYSLLYTENVSAANSQSAWGKTYHGVNCSAYFGTVCNEFAKYAAGCAVDFDTPFDKWLHEHRLTFAKVFDQSAQGVRIGDIWWQSGHNRIITGIKRNEDGDVTNVIVSEAANIKVIVTEMTASAFDALIASQHAIIYRSIELYMNRYTPSPYIPLGDEDATPVTYNDDICTFAGDMATFREGDTIVIDYNLKSVGAWTEMELYKNDELVDTITIDTSAHYVNLTSRNLTYGKYKARMKNGSNYSDFTHWEILQTTVSHAFVGGKSSVTFSSNNGKPWYYILGTQAGNRTVMNSLTDDELSAGKVVVDFNAMQKQQRYNNEDLTGTYYLKVKFRGDYGCVTNDPLPVVF